MPVSNGVSRTHYRAGMPELVFTGLSEQWLLRTCGDLHWSALAQQAGMSTPDFYDQQGQKAYAAFVALRIREARLEDVTEHQRFAIESEVMRVPGVRHFGRYRVLTPEACVANVEMVSTFVRRERTSDNHSVSRAMFDSGAVKQMPAAAAALIDQAKRFRTDDWTTHGRLSRHTHAIEHQVEYLPCPSLDFNGANLLYFVSFAAMVERA